MTYAVIATYKLPDTMGGAVIAEVCLGRFANITAAKEARDTTDSLSNDLAVGIHELLESKIGCALSITYHIRFEGE